MEYDLAGLPTMGRDGLASIILPSLTLGLAISSVYVRLLRSSLLESLSQEFVRSARARGCQKDVFLFYTLFDIVSPPVITVFGLV
ncbi:ABC-type dipeptide/oligopeptide/nickel transport system permease component [Neobacillus niacini]|nr:ABC-type dipeptide/oligopeptide/nickel transport system permease component [Neobacillus niacini]